jgi:hypothetical protein
MIFKNINDLKKIKGLTIKMKNIKSFLKALSKVGYGYIDYNKFINSIQKYGGITLYNENKPTRILASYMNFKDKEYIIINKINTVEDMYIILYNHKLIGGYEKNNVQLVFDEHTLSGRKIIEGNLKDSEVENIKETKQYEYDGVSYNVRKIIEEEVK